MSTSSKYIISISDLSLLRTQLAKQTVVLGTGCFDLLHVGHLHFLIEARKQGEVLVVGINSDDSIGIIKGPHRPIQKEDQRSELIGALRYVDYVFIYDDVVADSCILRLKPDIYAIGEESVETYPSELAAANSIGTRIHVVRRIRSASTTSIVETVLSQNEKKSQDV